MEEINFSRFVGGREMDTRKWKVTPTINAAVKLVVRKTRTLFYKEFSTNSALCKQSIASDQSLTETALQMLTASTAILIFVTKFDFLFFKLTFPTIMEMVPDRK